MNLQNEWTPLHTAAAVGHVDIVACLVSNGAKMSASSLNEITPLHIAAERGHLKVVEYLIASGARYDAKKQTSRHCVATEDLSDYEQFVIRFNIDINRSNATGWTPLHAAARRGCLEVAKCLISHGADITRTYCNGTTSLHTAAENGHLDVVECLVSNGADISALSAFGTPLHVAATRGHLDVVEYLIANGAEVDALVGHYTYSHHFRRTPLNFAAHRHLDVVECLMAHGANVNHKDELGRMLLHFPEIYSRVSIVERVVESLGKGIISVADQEGRTAMHFAAGHGNMDAFEFLIAHGGNVLIPDKHGRVPLHYAAAHGHLNIVKYLTKHDEDVNILDMGGCAPIHYAAAYQKDIIIGIFHAADVVEHLISCGANIEIKAKCCRGFFCSNLLCRTHAIDKIFVNPYRQSSVAEYFRCHEMRPAHLVCGTGNIDVLRCLLVSGCMMNVKDESDQTPDDYANQRHDVDGLELLAKHKADRQGTEYSLWHFKDVCVIIRNFKIFCISSVIDAVKITVLPIDAPIILFGIDNFVVDCYKCSLGLVLHLVSNKFQYDEHFVAEDNDRIKDVLLRLEQRRGWQCVLLYPGTRKKVPQELTVVKYLRFYSSADVDFGMTNGLRWIDNGALSVNYCYDAPITRDDHYAEALFVWCHGNQIMRPIKKAIIETFQRNILYGIKQKNDDINISEYFLKRLATNKADCLQFLANGEMIRESTTVADILNQQVNIAIRQKFVFKSIDFILVSEEAILQGIVDKSKDPFVLQPIFPCHPLVLGPLSAHLLVHDVRTALKNQLKMEDVILFHNGRIPKGLETVPQKADCLMEYAVVYSCPKLSERREIGRGSFGRVFKCKENNSDYFALKVMSMSNDSESLSDIEWDVHIMRELIIAAKVPVHDRIMRYEAFYKEMHTFGCNFCIRMPLMETSLRELLTAGGPLSETDIRHFSNQILQGLNHLHQNMVMHRDLKGANVLIDKDRNVRLCDFGLSKHLKDLAFSQAAEGQVGSCVGTLNWMAPEVMKEPTVYGIKADVWSFGATVVEMITGQPPYVKSPQFQLVSKVMEEGVIEYDPPSSLSHELKSFVDSCLRKEPGNRLFCADLLRHPFLMR